MAFCSLEFLLAPTCLITPLRMRSPSEMTFHLRRDMLCQGVNDWTKKIMTQGSFAYWTHKSFFLRRWFGTQKDSETLRSSKNDRSIQDYFSTSHASHLYEPRSRPKPKAVRLKNAPIGHQPSALAALSISNVALVGLSPIARFLRCTLNRGVR